MSMIHRRQRTIAICLVLLVGVIQGGQAGAVISANCSNQGTGEWQRYTASGEEFSVLLPISPAMNTSTLVIDQRRSRRERTLGAYANGVVYAVYTFQKESLSIDDVVHRTMKYFESAQPAGPITVDGITGQSFRFETDTRMGALEFFATAQNYYAFQVVGSKLGNPTDGIPKFLSSIRFRKEPGSVDVVDGPGDQPPANTDPSQSSGPVLPARQVTTKASVIIKPEPRYTEEARQNQISGTVVLRAVFSSSGAVTNIQPVSNLPDGLTDQAIAAARQIRFIPPIKDGRFVSMYIQIEYNFNLY